MDMGPHPAAHIGSGNRVAVAVDPRRAITIHLDSNRFEVLIRPIGQRQKPGPLTLKAFLDGPVVFPTRYPVSTVAVTALHKQLVELIKVLDSRQGNQKVSSCKPDDPLHPSFLVSLAGIAEAGSVRVVTAKGHKALLFDPPPSSKDLLHRQGQIVINEFPEYSTVVVEGVHVSVKEHLLTFPGISPNKELARVARAHHKQFDPASFSPHLDPCRSPVHFRFPRHFRIQRNHCLLASPALGHFPFPDPATHRQLSSWKTLLLHQPPVDPTRRMPLFLGPRPVLSQPLLHHPRHGIHHRALHSLFPSILRFLSRQGLADGLPVMPRVPSDLSNTFSVNSLCCSDKLVLIHPNHSRTSVSSADYSFQQTKRGLIGVGHFYSIIHH